MSLFGKPDAKARAHYERVVGDFIREWLDSFRKEDPVSIAEDEYHASLRALNEAEGRPKGSGWRYVWVLRATTRHRLAVRALAKTREVKW